MLKQEHIINNINNKLINKIKYSSLKIKRNGNIYYAKFKLMYFIYGSNKYSLRCIITDAEDLELADLILESKEFYIYNTETETYNNFIKTFNKTLSHIKQKIKNEIGD